MSNLSSPPFTVTVNCTTLDDLQNFSQMVVSRLTGSSTPTIASQHSSAAAQQAMTSLSAQQPPQQAALEAPKSGPALVPAGPALPPAGTGNALADVTPVQFQKALTTVMNAKVMVPDPSNAAQQIVLTGGGLMSWVAANAEAGKKLSELGVPARLTVYNYLMSLIKANNLTLV